MLSSSCLHISIPLWFDCEREMDMQEEYNKAISIPLWFDCELRFPLCAICASADFNSTMVRLWGEINELSKKISNTFQFHYGSIVRETLSFLQKAIDEFQFHYGSIVRNPENETPMSYDVFQFHYGSIVRLHGHRVRFMLIEFQFHYGSIVRSFPTTTSQTKRIFQFHYGSIVRAKTELNIGSMKFISIPLWFDCEINLNAEISL